MKRSLWRETAKLPAFEKLSGDIKTDVLIIGGGITGILCAHMLDREGVDYVLVEADRLCGGVTGDTTAKITLQHGFICNKLVSRFGTEMAEMYIKANQAALDEYRRLCADIDCGYETEDNWVYSLRPGESEKEYSALEQIGGLTGELAYELPLPMAVAGGVKIGDQARFHPLKFLACLAEGLKIYEHTPVREMLGTTAVTDKGSIGASKVIVATHFPFINKHGSYYMKLYQHRSYVLALEGAENPEGMFVDEQDRGLSFRKHGDLLLLGGGGHRTGKKGGGWQELEKFAKERYPGAAEKYRWATQDCMSLDGVPYIGQYSKNTPDMYVATGFNKWGMSSSMAAAMLLRDLVLGRENPCAPVFSPSRSMIRPQLLVNFAESALHLINPGTKRCPHMGCALKWNSQERSWDCPCHGSRFTEKGELLNNPAEGNMKKEPGPGE